MAGPQEQGVLADLGLPAADRAAATGDAVRVDRDVADLAAVAGDAGQRLAVDDEAAADADLAVDEQDVLGADGRAAPDLGQGAQVGIVGDRDRRRPVERERPGARPSGTSRQPRFGAIETKPSLRRTTPTIGDADADVRLARRSARAELGGQLGEVGRRSASTEEWPRGRSTRTQVEDLAAQADHGDGERIDGDLEGQDDRALGVQPDERRRPAGRAERRRALLGHETGVDELADEAADRAPGQAGPGDELGSGERAADVQLTDDRAQVRPANGLAPLPDHDLPNRHVFCVPLFQMCAPQTLPTRLRCQDSGPRSEAARRRRARRAAKRSAGTVDRGLLDGPIADDPDPGKEVLVRG